MLLLPFLVLALQLSATSAIERAALDGVRGGVFPGAVVVVGTHDRVLLSRGYGRLTWSSSGATPSSDSTLYDLASLTKVVATTPAVMLLVQAGRLDLDRPVQHYLPEFTGDDKERVTVRHLLEHRSGMRAFLPLNERASTAAEARQIVLTEPLRFDPGGRIVYSDLNAMLLGWIVERVAGVPLDRFVEENVFGPLGMRHTLFKPPRALRPRIAPVGIWRGYVIAGQVHDQNAARLGGVSGHAGLYSTGLDLARYAQLWLNEGHAGDGMQLLLVGTVRHFARRGPGNRALGWELRDTTSAEDTGTLLSPAAFGHGGYTGTSLWIDPVRDLFVIVLTNRVFAPRTRRSISRLKDIRGRIADAAVALRREVCGPADPRPGATKSC
ncbi:MAG: serine hydrolase [Gemmatimonadales bacterium]|nr:serine hydrolase [Gemmatimonadales bacterium]NIN10428.1 serine hydrolase [Gemmatimonadales bacterium]NIN49220.1 serine hydrolase [Gemmatimonadales bacterium]NIP06684.1 serine hydrolase [Gemmatimonadales bacterium]NIR00015.1 serine hydrolase [Gemmatimonadales bacterium]